MADIVISAVAKIAEYTVTPVLRQFGYLIYYKSNVKDLTEKVTTLTAKRDGVQLRVDGAKRNLEPILPEVQNWLERVNQTIEEKEICFKEERTEKAKICCSSNRWCPNLKVRHSLSRRAKKLGPRVDELIGAANFTTVSGPAPPPKLDYPAIQYVDDYTEAPVKRNEAASSSSATSNPTNSHAPMSLSERLKYRLPFTKDLLTALQDEKISVIGISGTVREIDTIKTEEFIKLMKEKKLFEEVVMAVASQDPDVKRIQGEVAEMLDLKLEKGSLVERAERLRAVLSASESKRILVILADVCGILDWEAVGVSPVDIMKSCKIMLISQLPNVFGEMVTQRNFKLLVHSTPIARPVEFESRISVIRGVMDALTDDVTNPIVLCGMGGIGKTTLLMEIAAKACEVDLFDDVADAEFTQEPDLIKIQGKLAKGLGLKLEADDDRAAKLRERLSGGAKRKLLILDNVWTGPNLWEIGIPITRDPTCCKLLVSSRNQDIFHEMKAKKCFLIDGLPKHDAWSLFKKVAGSSIEFDPVLLPIAEQVLDECDGLPVAISTVGGALQGKSIPEWRNAHRELRNACPENVPGVIKHVYGKIVFSYECLPSEQLKSFFLLCCLLPESRAMPIENLVRYVIGLDLLNDIDSISEARDCVQALVDTLKCRSLLLNTNEKDSVRMHDVVHDVARYIASEESAQKRNEQLERRIVLRQGVELNHWRRSNGIMESAFCCSLTTNMSTTTELLLLETPDGRQPEMLATLFNGMEDLKVLSISTLVLPFLPHLKKLRALALVNCHLDFAEIGELRTLMILNLETSDIKQLTDEFRKLSNLRLLDLTRCWNLEVISPGVISSLSRLEELYMWDSFQDWGLEKLASTETTHWISQLMVDARPQEVDTWKRLNKLAVKKLTSTERTTYYREVRRVEELSQKKKKKIVDYEEPSGARARRDFFAEYVEVDELRDVFAEYVGGIYDDFHLLTGWANSMDWRVGSLSELLSLSGLTALEVVLPPIDILLTSKLFHKLERFKISIGWKKLRYTKQMDIGNYLRVHDLDASSLAGPGISLLLKKTKTLELGMKNLIDPLNVLDVNWSANLESLNLQGCHSLEYLIDLTLQEYTPQSVLPVLNNLSITGAERLKGIIHCDPLHTLDVNCFANLESLTLAGCHSLEYLIDVSLRKNALVSVFPVLNNLCIINAERLKGIIRGDPLNVFDVNCCPKLKSLTLHDCDSLEYLIDLTLEEYTPLSVFPVLENLSISSAERLKGIIHGDILNALDVNCFPNLESLDLEECHSLEYLIDMSVQKHTPLSVFPVLKTLNVTRAQRLKEIFHGDLPQGSLRKLERVNLMLLPALTSICIVESQSAAAGDLAALKSIEISDCPSLEVIFGLKGCGDHVKEINFHSLTILELERVPSLMGISINSRDCHLTIEPALFSNPKVVFPLLKDVKIKGLSNLKKIWNNQLSHTSFSQLRSLLVQECDNLLHLGPTQMQQTFQNLETITIIKCSSMKEFFEVRRLTVGEGNASVSQSESIVSNTSQPDQGMQIIMDFKQACQGFQNLTSLVVDSCDKLRYLLSLSIAKGLVKLQRLEIKSCTEIETIVAADDRDETENNESLLPQLDYLKLWYLPNLGSFSQAKYTIDWPLLRGIDIGYCKKMNKFCSGSLSISRKVKINVSGCGENLEQELNNSRRES